MVPMGFYVLSLMLSLASPSFDTREAAAAELTRLVRGWPLAYGPAVESFARTPAARANPETSRRLSSLGSIYRRHLAANYVPPGNSWPPCYYYPRRVLWFDVADTEAVPPVWINALTGDPVSEWDCDINFWDCELVYSDPCAGTERMARAMLWAGADPAEVDALILRMQSLMSRK